jgi:hypothetical protein
MNDRDGLRLEELMKRSREEDRRDKGALVAGKINSNTQHETL